MHQSFSRHIDFNRSYASLLTISEIVLSYSKLCTCETSSSMSSFTCSTRSRDPSRISSHSVFIRRENSEIRTMSSSSSSLEVSFAGSSSDSCITAARAAMNRFIFFSFCASMRSVRDSYSCCAFISVTSLYYRDFLF